MTGPEERSELAAMSVAALARKIRKRELSSIEVAEYFLRRIRTLDDQLHAWTTVDAETVRRDARVLDGAIATGPLGPLHGVPIGIKDLFFTKDLRTTMGSRVFAEHVPSADADAVARLRAAGAIILGKTVTTEFATLDPPPTRNPWNRSHTPGGSSSGSAAAVAVGMCPAATASQTVGSLGRPAAYCGLVGLLPTASTVSLDGVFPVAWTLDHAGVFARSLEDARLVLNGMSRTPVPLTDVSKRPQVGIVREFFRDVTHEAAWAVHEQFLSSLREAGVEVVELKLPPVFRFGLPAVWTIMRAELASVHERIYPVHRDEYGPTIRSLIESGLLLQATDYLRALRVRRTFQREMVDLFANCDVILSPGAPGPAPRGLESTGPPLLQAPWTLADFPTVSLPLTLTAERLPIGIQVTGPPSMEADLFEYSRWMEGFIGFSEQPAQVNAYTQ
jgi:Asp-tRNA(Asn)/Glu-tRNA(Gln) amidotransferase A subunit family amidase